MCYTTNTFPLSMQGVKKHNKYYQYKKEDIQIPTLDDYPGPIFHCQKCGKLTDENSACVHCKTKYDFVINQI